MVKKICNVLSSIILVLMLLLAGVLLVPHIFGYRPTAVLTGSMEPVYHVGSVIFVKEVAPEDVEVGDVITFSTPGMSYPTTHRVISIDKDKQVFVTQGEANNVADGEIAFSRLLGRPASVSIPLVGYISHSIQTSMTGKLVAGGVVLLVILLAFLPDMLGKKKTASGAETQEPIQEADETKSSTGVDIPSDTEEKT